MSKNIYVLVEYELEGDNKHFSILGAFDSIKEAGKSIPDYYGHYGDFVELYHQNIRDLGVEWTKEISINGIKHKLDLAKFKINEI